MNVTISLISCILNMILSKRLGKIATAFAGAAVGLAGLLGTGESQMARAATIDVNPSQNVSAINSVIAGSNPGDTINFTSGSYELDYQQFYDFYPDRNYTFDSAIINGIGQESGNLIKIKRGGNIDISGDLTIQNSKAGMIIGGTLYTDINISGVTFNVSDMGVIWGNIRHETDRTAPDVNFSYCTLIGGSTGFHFDSLNQTKDNKSPYVSLDNITADGLGAILIDLFVNYDTGKTQGDENITNVSLLNSDAIICGTLWPLFNSPHNVSQKDVGADYINETNNCFETTTLEHVLGTYIPIINSDSRILTADGWIGAYKPVYAGDSNLDGEVDVGDLGILAGNWNLSGKTWQTGDSNNDGVVDVGDLGTLAGNWGSIGPRSPDYGDGGQQNVPEPTSLALLAFIAGIISYRRPRLNSDTVRSIKASRTARPATIVAILAMILASLLGTGESQRARAATIDVNPSQSVSAINSVIAGSTPGDTINFTSGNYDLNYLQFYDFYPYRNYTFDSVIVSGIGAEQGSMIRILNGGNINISGDLTLQNSVYGMTVGGLSGSPTYSNIYISGVTFDVQNMGVIWRNIRHDTDRTAPDVYFSDCTLIGGSTGFHFDNGGIQPDSKSPFISVDQITADGLGGGIPGWGILIDSFVYEDSPGHITMAGNEYITDVTLLNSGAVITTELWTWFESPSNLAQKNVTDNYINSETNCFETTTLQHVPGTYIPIINSEPRILTSDGWIGAYAPAYAGDSNLDGEVDVGDLGILAGNWSLSGKTWQTGDYNNDGVVDVGDLGVLAGNWGSVGPRSPAYGAGGQQNVPEPTSLALLALAAGVISGLRSKPRLGRG